MTKPNELPEELRQELAYYKGPGESYSGRDLVLARLAHAKGPVTTNDLITYVWQVNGTVIKRTYLYQMLYKLRKNGLAKVGEPLRGVKRFQATPLGEREAKPYVKPEKK
jgi:DNA-binding PadR family transcriptional regulator